MSHIKASIVKHIMFWFDVDLYDLIHCQSTNVKASQAFSAMCQLLIKENLLFTQSLTPEELVKYFNAFSVPEVNYALYNHSAYLNNSNTYPTIYKNLLKKGNELINKNYEVSKN